MRSKTLFVSNVLSTVYTGYLLWAFGGAIISAGGMEYIEYCRQTFDALFKLFGFSSVELNVIYIVLALLAAHIVFFVIGVIFAWIGYLAKKSGIAKFAATLYLIATICFPIYIFAGLPLTIVGFVGGGKQKKINKTLV